jgi:hypothetical protein
MAAQQAFVVQADEGWAVKVSGSVVSGPHRTQSEAQDGGRTWLLANGGGELVTQGEDGRIRSKDTIGRDDPRGNG